MKQLINFKDPASGERVLGVITPGQDEVKTASKGVFSLRRLRKRNQDGGIGFFETKEKGQVIQKSGEFHGQD